MADKTPSRDVSPAPAETNGQPLLPAGEQPKLLAAPPPPGPKPVPRRKIILWGLLALLLLIVLFLVGYLPRRHRNHLVEAAARRRAEALPIVNVTQVKRSEPVTGLLLPGNITPLTEAYIYARATGYVSRRYVDIGDRVHAGQILAEIDAPDLDQEVAQARAALAQSEEQLSQARASLENAQAQEELARVTWERYRVLVQHGAVSRQDADQQLANYKSQTANVHLQEAAVRTNQENVRASRANLDREIALQSFKQVRAPFNGVITARNFDVGALVSTGGGTQGSSTTPMGGSQSSAASGNAGVGGASSSQQSQATGAPGIGSSGELFRVAQVGIVRVLVNVPQANAPAIVEGQSASVFVSEYSKREFTGKVTRTSRSLDEVARTLVAEVDVANPDFLLLPGMYTQVQFHNRLVDPPLLVPGDSIMATPNGLEVAIMIDPTPEQRQKLQKEMEQQKKRDAADPPPKKDKKDTNDKNGESDQDAATAPDAARRAKRVHILKIEVGRDYGLETEVTNGLQGWEYVVTNPGDAVEEGTLVIPTASPDIAGAGGSQGQAQSQQHPSGIGAPVMVAPTQGAPSQGAKKGGDGKKGNDDKKGSAQ
jgi:multidrug efflux pump subunit AcrA (membrane-fusion protein)